MKLDYGTLLSPTPIKLSIGTLRHPKLLDIADITFPVFDIYQLFLKITPEEYYTKLTKNEEYWKSLPDIEQYNMTMYDVLLDHDDVSSLYTNIFNFFFYEDVKFKSGVFVICKHEGQESISGIIGEKNFADLLNTIQQLCKIKGEEKVEDQKFKTKKARRTWLKMKKAEKENAKRRKANLNFTLPNIISAVAAKSKTLNIENIWYITLYQLYDQFDRLQINDGYERDSTSIAVWGDEKNKFDYTLWYKNIVDNK